MTRIDPDFQTDQMAARLAWMLDTRTMIMVSCSETNGSSVMKAGGFGDQVITARLGTTVQRSALFMA
jgi:hypothetical protein